MIMAQFLPTCVAIYSLFLKEIQECSSNWKTEVNIWHKCGYRCTSLWPQELEISSISGLKCIFLICRYEFTVVKLTQTESIVKDKQSVVADAYVYSSDLLGQDLDLPGALHSRGILLHKSQFSLGRAGSPHARLRHPRSPAFSSESCVIVGKYL
ncbi:hypothetical protein VNO80_23099 [Phaseolus coccineus]|uniref:Uncharacterized protein n=1 Tax=Phaseolus coccineus TaxID=3886 RepID=A0AAN9M642_PHACN